MQELAITGILAFLSLVAAVFFIIRGFDKFTGWRDGNKDDLWIFLSLWVGAAGAIFSGVPWLAYLIAEDAEDTIGFLSVVFPLGICLALAEVVLSTIYYIMKWRAPK